jgi:hypothetical protein
MIPSYSTSVSITGVVEREPEAMVNTCFISNVQGLKVSFNFFDAAFPCCATAGPKILRSASRGLPENPRSDEPATKADVIRNPLLVCPIPIPPLLEVRPGTWSFSYARFL